MPSPFDPLGYDAFQKRVEKPSDFDDVYAVLYEDDHYRKGKGFLGPTGAEGTASSSASPENPSAAAGLIDSRLKKAFTPEDLLGEVVGRRIKGVLGRPPQWRAQVRRELEDGQEPTPEEQERLERMARGLRAWEAARRVNDALRLWAFAASAFGHAYLRPYVPSGRGERGADGTLSLNVKTPEEALDHVFLDVVLPDVGLIYTDPRSQYRASIALFGEMKDAEDKKIEARAEVSFRDVDGAPEGPEGFRAPNTVLRVLEKGKGAQDADEVVVPVRGRLFLIELREERPFVTPSMLRQQDALNTASTEMRIVNDDAGFPVRLLLGAMPPGEWKEVTVEGGKKVWQFTPSEYRLKPGQIAHVQGSVVPDAEATAAAGTSAAPAVKDIKDPRAATFEAATPDGYETEMDRREYAILRRAKQLFALISGDAAASGESRAQALDDFLLDAHEFAERIDAAASAAYEVVWDFANYLAGAPAADYDLEVEFRCRVTVPRLSPAEQQSTLRLMSEGVWSRERTMSVNGVDDPAAEREKVVQERADEEAALVAALDGALDDDEGEGEGEGDE